MGKSKNGFLSDNYIEKWEFTKIEVILLAGVLLIFLPFVLLPINDNITEIEKLVVIDENGKYDNAKKAILKELDIVDQESKYEKAKELILAKFNDEITIETKKKELAINEEDEKRVKEAENRIEKIKENIERIDESIYKHLKSPEYENRIYIAFSIAMFLLILTVYLSHKGYTSYTPWLEKLANDKFQFDLQLYQYVEYKKIEKFYRETFRVKESKKVDESQLLGWKPVDEGEKRYSVFSEKLDYRFYELAFEKLWPEWSEDNYNRHRNGVGEYEPKYNRRRELYDNPELVPNMNNEEIKNEL